MIWFNYPNAFHHLMIKGTVYTLRKSRKREGFHRLHSNLTLVPLNQYVKINYIKFVRKKEELEDYYRNSGYESIDAWVNAAGGAPNLHFVMLTSVGKAVE